MCCESFSQRGGVSLKDVGSQASQLYLSCRESGLNFDYHGYEVEKKYVEVAVRNFPELEERIQEADFLEVAQPPVTEVSVVSATLEHIDRWEEFLGKVLSSTSSLALIRTFLGNGDQRFLAHKAEAAAPYPVWQFDAQSFLQLFADYGFEVEVRRDKATDSLPVWKVFRGGKGVLRTCYLLVGKRTQSGEEN